MKKFVSKIDAAASSKKAETASKKNTSSNMEPKKEVSKEDTSINMELKKAKLVGQKMKNSSNMDLPKKKAELATPKKTKQASIQSERGKDAIADPNSKKANGASTHILKNSSNMDQKTKKAKSASAQFRPEEENLIKSNDHSHKVSKEEPKVLYKNLNTLMNPSSCPSEAEVSVCLEVEGTTRTDANADLECTKLSFTKEYNTSNVAGSVGSSDPKPGITRGLDPIFGFFQFKALGIFSISGRVGFRPDFFFQLFSGQGLESSQIKFQLQLGLFQGLKNKFFQVNSRKS